MYKLLGATDEQIDKLQSIYDREIENKKKILKNYKKV